MEFHQEQLHRHCRFCGKQLKERVTYKCSDTKYAEKLGTLGVDVSHDGNTVHPQYFFNHCSTATNIDQSQTTLGCTIVVPFPWSTHKERGREVSKKNTIYHAQQYIERVHCIMHCRYVSTSVH